MNNSNHIKSEGVRNNFRTTHIVLHRQNMPLALSSGLFLSIPPSPGYRSSPGPRASMPLIAPTPQDSCAWPHLAGNLCAIPPTAGPFRGPGRTGSRARVWPPVSGRRADCGLPGAGKLLAGEIIMRCKLCHRDFYGSSSFPVDVNIKHDLFYLRLLMRRRRL